MGEYGSPEKPEEREYLAGYSPYQNLKPDMDYPTPFFLTSTKDDRVHPGHARKMAARMMEKGHSIYYYENTEGGHSASANKNQRAKMYSLEYSYFWDKLARPVQ